MKLRKVLSLFVALVMMFEVLPLSSLATEIADATESVEVAAEAVEEENETEEAEETVEEVVEEEETVLLGTSADESGIATVSEDVTIIDSGTCGDDLTWVLDSDGVLTISGTGDMTDYSSSSAPWYSNNSSIISVVIESGVTSIGKNAFYRCINLASVTIPDSVTSLGFATFSGCTNLTSIFIPDSVTSIGDYVFQNCTSLKSVTISNSVTSISVHAFYNCTSLTSVIIPDGVTNIETGAFSCAGLTNINIPDSVTTIGTHAFYECANLTSISIPDSVTSIGDYVFQNCTSLKSVTISNSVTSISVHAFYNCTSLTSVIIPDGVISIGTAAFDGCISLLSVTIPDSVTSIGNTAFSYCSALTNITIPDSVTSIGNGAFTGCTGLTSITIPDSVTSLGGAFESCSSLTSVTLSKNITSIGSSAFRSCTSLTNIIIPDSVTTIGTHAFYGCTGLTSITVPENVTSIYGSAFADCTSLTSVDISSSMTVIDYYAFSGCKNLTDVYYDGTVSEWNSITIDSGNDPLLSATIHCTDGIINGDETTYFDDEETSYGSVYYLASYNEETGVLELGGNLYDVYVLEDDVDTTGISDMVGDFVLVSYKQDEESMLKQNVSSVLPVESAIGVVTEQSDSTITIDGVTYDFSSWWVNLEETEVLYFTYSGEIVGCRLPKTSTGDLDEWDNTASTVTIDGTVYPVLSVTDLSFLANVDTYLGKEVTLVTYEVSGYTIVGSISHTPVTEFSFYSTTSTGFIGLGTTKGMFISYLVDGDIDIKSNEFIIVVDDNSIIEVTPVEWYDDYGMLYSITAKSVGTANLTVTNALNGDSATLAITVFKDELVYRFDEVPKLTYEEGKTTNFYNFNGMVVDEFKYTPHKNSDGYIEYYTVTMTIYNTLDLYGMVVSYDSQGNPQGYYVIDKKDAIETSLADNLEELWNATGDIFYLWNNSHYYSGESISKKTEVELTVPVGGYLEISNSANNEIVALANVVGLVIDTIKLAYDEVSGLDDETKTIADILTENIVEKQVLKTVKKTVVNELKDIDWYDSYCIEVLFDKLEETGIDLFDAIKKKISVKTGVSIAESSVNKVIPTGKIIDALWTFTDALELIAHWVMLDGSEDFSSGIYLYSPSNNSSINSNAISVTSSNSNVTIHAYLVVDSDEVEVTNQTITDSTYEIYSITMYKDGEVTQPDSTVSVKIPITETFDSIDSSTLKVYRVNDDGTITDMNATVVDGYLVFETDHFSYYAVVGNEIDKDAELISEAKATLSSTDWALTQSDVESATGSTTADKIATLIDAILAELGIDSNVTVTYTITDITEAIAGDATDVDGTDGSFTINFAISAGNESDTLTETGTITATAYVHTHSLTHVEAVDATCTAEGNTEYWYCSGCDKYYSDENAENEITLADTVTAKIAHNYEAVVTEPTCTEGGYTTYTCSVCKDSYVADEVEATGHNYEAVVTEPTCTEGGYTTYTCLVCKDSYVADETAALGHDYTSEVIKEATCTEAGVMTYTCIRGDDSYTEEIPATGHTEAEAVVENEVAATCTTDGSYDSVVYCTVCGEELSRETIVVPAAHTAGTAVRENVVEATRTTEGSYDLVTYCTVCGEEISRETVTVPATGVDMITVWLRTPADYSAVNNAIAKANVLNSDDYTNFSDVTDAINAVNWTYNALMQSYVNEMAEKIETAIANLVPVGTTTEEVEIQEPIEDTNTDTEEDEDEPSETSEPESNPATGIAFSVLPMVIAALVAASAKRR